MGFSTHRASLTALCCPSGAEGGWNRPSCASRGRSSGFLPRSSSCRCRPGLESLTKITEDRANFLELNRLHGVVHVQSRNDDEGEALVLGQDLDLVQPQSHGRPVQPRSYEVWPARRWLKKSLAHTSMKRTEFPWATVAALSLWWDTGIVWGNVSCCRPGAKLSSYRVLPARSTPWTPWLPFSRRCWWPGQDGLDASFEPSLRQDLDSGQVKPLPTPREEPCDKNLTIGFLMSIEGIF